MLTQARFAAVANERFVVSIKKMKQRSSFFLLVQNCIDFCVVRKDFKTSYDLYSSLSIHRDQQQREQNHRFRACFPTFSLFLLY